MQALKAVIGAFCSWRSSPEDLGKMSFDIYQDLQAPTHASIRSATSGSQQSVIMREEDTEHGFGVGGMRGRSVPCPPKPSQGMRGSQEKKSGTRARRQSELVMPEKGSHGSETRERDSLVSSERLLPQRLGGLGIALPCKARSALQAGRQSRPGWHKFR